MSAPTPPTPYIPREESDEDHEREYEANRTYTGPRYHPDVDYTNEIELP